ncbi:MAG: mercury methylation corrinoid protein HgcA [Desulfosalsimonadaceae bacterium]
MPFEDQKIPQVGPRLTRMDRLGAIKVRWGIGRMNYRIDPGLYAFGNPDNRSDVLVTANYKLSFDSLRSALPRHNAWILVLDTDAVNVWCAAGKGAFGTAELVRRIASSRLPELVSHRRLIVPQLGASGIAAHLVKKQTGFEVIYGPILSIDLPEFITSGYKAAPFMRTKRFPFWERAVLIPMELIPALKWALLLICLMVITGGFGGPKTFFQNTVTNSVFAAMMLTGGLFAGAALTPAMLPLLPGKAFAFKGMAAGLMTSAVIVLLFLMGSWPFPGILPAMGAVLLSTGFASFLGMNFTGASTYTSLSGVRKEMRTAVPLQILAGIAGLLLWVASLFSKLT